VYVIGDGSGETGVVPIAAATGTVGAPAETRDDTVSMALTPDGRTLYVVGDNDESDPQDSIVTPISTATDTALAAIPDPGNPGPIGITRAHCSRK
jgi:hypothetical protein